VGHKRRQASTFYLILPNVFFVSFFLPIIAPNLIRATFNLHRAVERLSLQRIAEHETNITMTVAGIFFFFFLLRLSSPRSEDSGCLRVAWGQPPSCNAPQGQDITIHG
jgi:hypothetical protein